MEGLILKLSHSRLLELEELLGVVITDVLNHLIDAFHFGNGNFTVFHITAYEVTQRAAEIFMTRIGEERTRVCQHTYETAQQAEYGAVSYTHLTLPTKLEV